MRPLVMIIVLLFGSTATAQQLKEITNSIGMKLVIILPRSFKMGSPNEEEGRRQDESRHLVTISNWFYLGACEVTQGQFEKVMGVNPSKFKGLNKPVERVSWDDAILYCKKLSEMPIEKAAGREYRLPTEAEWEYACRATSSDTYSFGDLPKSLDEYAWFDENSQFKSHPVGEKKPNQWGLYDMHGNVLEWCQDVYADYPSGESVDPRGPAQNLYRVLRGGCLYFNADQCRSSRRFMWVQFDAKDSIGFRVAMSRPIKQAESVPSK